MAISSLAGLISGQIPSHYMNKATTTQATAAGQALTSWYSAGYPIAATPNSSGLSGQVLTSSTAAFPFSNPTSGNTYLSRFERPYYISSNGVNERTALLVDRLWENSGLDPTSTSAQTVNSVQWPARDIDGQTNGKGVFIAVETSAAFTSGTVVPITMTYTNSAGATGKTSSNIFAVVSSSPTSRWYVMGLEVGDEGVRSIQSITFTSSWGTGGTLHLVAFRPIVMLDPNASRGTRVVEDGLTMAMPLLWNDSVLQVVSFAQGNGSNEGGPYTVTYSQG